MKFVLLDEHGVIIKRDPAPLTVDGMVHYHPTDEMYEAQGWLRYVDTPMPVADPGEGMQWERSYTNDGKGNCVVKWVAAAIPAPPEPDTSILERIEKLENEVKIVLSADDGRLASLVDDSASAVKRSADQMSRG